MSRTPLRASELKQEPLSKNLTAVLNKMMRVSLETLLDYATLAQLVELQDSLSGGTLEAMDRMCYLRTRSNILNECTKFFRAASRHPQITTLFWRHCKPAMRFWSVQEAPECKRIKKK
jgi:hypothetical protein